MSLFDDIGGEAGLRAVLTDFYDRVFADPMIGYLFMGQRKARLVELELQFTARVMGADVRYEGRSIRAAHAAHNIRKGHFRRRNRLLEETLRDHGVPPHVIEGWLSHARALERAVLSSANRDDPHCDSAAPADPSVTVVEYG